MNERLSDGSNFVAFPAIEKHGLIGDRRTGALVAACGSIDWFCTPEFDGPPIFGALLDPESGGFCRFGPQGTVLGKQRYLPGTAALVTTWENGEDADAIELTDIMAWPENARPEGMQVQRVIIRRIRVSRDATIRFELCPARGFADRAETQPYLPLALAAKATLDTFQAATLTRKLWVNFRAFSLYSLVTVAATFLALPTVLPEAAAAWRKLIGER